MFGQLDMCLLAFYIMLFTNVIKAYCCINRYACAIIEPHYTFAAKPKRGSHP